MNRIDALSVPDRAELVELLPLAAYAVRAPYGVIAWYNKRAAELWGRSPVPGDTEERFCGAHKLFRPDGSYMAHCDTPVAAALYTGVSVHEDEVIIEKPDGARVTVSVNIDPIRDKSGAIIGAVNFFYDVTAQKESERALRESEERYRTLAESLEHQVRVRTEEFEEQSKQLRALSNRLVKTQDDERRHLARELHDSAGQLLAALSINLDRISQDENLTGNEMLQDSHKILQQLSSEIRTMSYLLHPPLLDDIGLCRALDLYIEGVSERSGIDVDLDCPEDFDRLPNDFELAIFRIVQECLTNIHRHSGSKTARIELARYESGICVDIQDHGRGFQADKSTGLPIRSGVGITGMRERVRHLGGSMNIKSSGKGTKVSVVIPLNEATESETQQTSHQIGAKRAVQQAGAA